MRRIHLIGGLPTLTVFGSVLVGLLHGCCTLKHWGHVGIYSGNGYIVHGSGYYGNIVESKMRYIKGY